MTNEAWSWPTCKDPHYALSLKEDGYNSKLAVDKVSLIGSLDHAESIGLDLLKGNNLGLTIQSV